MTERSARQSLAADSVDHVISQPTTALFREAVSRFATGITVVTCKVGTDDHAMTANSFTSVSLDPLLVLVCVERDSRFHDAIASSQQWAVSVLPADAEPVARWLATKGRPLQGQLDTVAHTAGPATGAALLTDALTTLECQTYATYEGGDHDIVVGRVLDLTMRRDDRANSAVVYYRRNYSTITHQPG